MTKEINRKGACLNHLEPGTVTQRLYFSYGKETDMLRVVELDDPFKRFPRKRQAS